MLTPTRADAALDATEFLRLAARLEPLARAGEDAATIPAFADYDHAPDVIEAETRPACPAAVLVPVVARQPLTLLFTLRTGHLPAHAGQISFPGGKVDETDDGPVATALREAEEEIGLDRRLVTPLGCLDRYRTGTGFCITPVVALVEPAFALTLNPHEVVDAFEVPLSFLMDERNHHKHDRLIAGRARRFYAMPYENRFIWGATAGILRNMHKRLFSA